MAVTLCVYNLKGGIGKTAASYNIASQLAMNGKKVLAIDGDRQQNLTQAFLKTYRMNNLRRLRIFLKMEN